MMSYTHFAPSNFSDAYLAVNPLMVPWWNLAARPFPIWMAPNLITLTGYVFVLINVATLALYIPDLIGPGPSWVYMSFAIGLFLYQTFDNVDGRQARRTGTSSALGHIFDHTIDSLNCALGGLVQAASLGLGNSPKGLFVILVGCAAMWLSTWEEYHTGSLYLGYFNGPTEGILIACLVHTISAAFGPQTWLRPIQSLPMLDWMPPNLLLHDIIVYMALISLVLVHIPSCFVNVWSALNAKNRPFAPTVPEHIPFILWTTLTTLWAVSPHSVLLHAHGPGLIPFALLATFTFGKLGPRIILAHLTRSPFPRFNFGAFAPLVVGALYVNLPYVSQIRTDTGVEAVILYFGIIFSTFAFLHWANGLCRGFMTTLDIGCFTIKPKKATLAHKSKEN